MAIVFFFYWAAYGALSPFLTLYYKQLGLSAAQISLLVSIAPVLLLISQPIFGPLTDQSGHRGRMLARLILITVLGGLLLMLGRSFWTLLPLVALWSFFAGTVLPIADSIALGEAARTGASYPHLRLWGSVGWLLVCTVMGRLYDHISLRWAFPLWAAIMMICWYWARRLPAEGVSARRSVWPALRALLRNRRLLALLVLSGLMAMANAGHAAFFSVHVAAMGGTNQHVGWAWGVTAAIEVPVWMVLGKVSQRVGPLPLLAFSGIAYGVRFFLNGLTTAPMGLVWLQVLQGLTFAIFMPTVVGYVGEVTGDAIRTSGQALVVLINSGVAAILGTLIAGQLAGRYGTAVMYYGMSGIALVAGLGFLGLMATLKVRKRMQAA